ncbi:MAG TPA: DUF177 domain-containing protein [Pyrinomonadaceae bacterium]|nr:DUF177 domain-containing protein [Pyrinomonadaceae bacterium]
MKIELAKLDASNGKFAHAYASGELELNDARVTLVEPPNISGRISREARKIRVEGNMHARAKVECDRCLVPIELPVDSTFKLDYVTPAEYESIHAHELAEEDLTLSVFDGVSIDLDEIAREQVLLAVPAQTLCRTECKGLCVTCGADLNSGDCGCEVAKIDPRWAGLKELVNRKQ